MDGLSRRTVDLLVALWLVEDEFADEEDIGTCIRGVELISEFGPGVEFEDVDEEGVR